MGKKGSLIDQFSPYKGTDLKADLDKLHTKQLMNIRTMFYNYSYDWNDPLREALNEVLAVREHIPNKLEAKKIRQEKAKQKQNR